MLILRFLVMTDNMLLDRTKNKNEKQPTLLLLITHYVTSHAFYILILDNIHDLNSHEEETDKTLHIT